jgi:outer membrane protein OmpA-like peptidoglycan-associated protein
MSRSRNAAAVVATALTAVLLTATAAGAQSAGMKTDIRDLKFERPRGLVFKVESIDGSFSDVQTDTEVKLTLAADVFFAFDKAELAPAAESVLADAAKRISAEAKGTVKIDGYTDSLGAAVYNRDLSQRRAEAVKAFLDKRKGVAAVTFVATGHGATDFVAENKKSDGSDNPEGRARNRRVAIAFNR